MVTFCQAKKSMSIPVVNWTCGENYIGKVGTLVADWNVLRDNVLEMGELHVEGGRPRLPDVAPSLAATPCAGGGYGWDEQGGEWPRDMLELRAGSADLSSWRPS